MHSQLAVCQLITFLAVEMALTVISKMAFFFISSASGNSFDLGGLLSQGQDILNQVKGSDGGLNISGIGNLLLDKATGAAADANIGGFDLGGVLKRVKEGEGLSLDTILGSIKKDENGKSNVPAILGRFGYSVKDVVRTIGLGKNDHVATVAEQFITDPENLDKGGRVALCEGLEALLEEKPQVGGSLAMLGMDTTTVCANR